MFPTASLSIAELFSGPYLLNIPVYQRPYSWEREQAEQLLDDVMEASGLASNAEADPGYFLGAVLLMDTPGNETAKLTSKMSTREFDVVDGQQRLVTLLTLLSVLRDLEVEPKKPVSKRVQSMLVAQQGTRFRRTERFRLHLAGRDRNIFEKNILQLASTAESLDPSALAPSETALLSVRDYYRSVLLEIPHTDRKTLADFVSDRCHVVVIVSHDIDRAYRMFVVLNERGKGLDRNDILKADILSRMSVGDVAWAAPAWDKMRLKLGDEFEPFFGHLRTVYGHIRPQIVSGVRNIVRDSGGPAPFFKDVFIPLSRSYALLKSGGNGTLPSEMVRRLFYLNRLPDADWAPAAILAVADWQKDPARAEFLLSEIDRLAHLTRLLCAGHSKRVRRFSDLIKAIRRGEPIDERHPSLVLSREESRNIAFHLRDLHKRNAKICKLILLRLGDELDGSMSDVDPELYSIEHILPQRPAATSVWRQLFPNEEDRSRLVESLGNMVLITQKQNGSAKNDPWEKKKEIYGMATLNAPVLSLTRDVLDEREWRRSQIESREKRLIDLIERIWRLEIQANKPGPRAERLLPLQNDVDAQSDMNAQIVVRAGLR